MSNSTSEEATGRKEAERAITIESAMFTQTIEGTPKWIVVLERFNVEDTVITICFRQKKIIPI